MEKISLSEILTSSVKTVSPHADISEVLEIMAKQVISCVVAVDEENRPLGIFTERDAVHLLAERRCFAILTMADVMSAPPFSSLADLDFREAYRILQERQYRHLVVVDTQGILLGIITEGDFLHHLDAGDLSEFKKAENVMSKNIVTVDVDDLLVDAISLMSRNRYSCVVVMRDQKPYGIITERDVVKLAEQVTDNAGILVSRVVNTPLISVLPTMMLPEAIKLMDKHQIRHLVIVDQDKLLGLVTRHDLVKTLRGNYVHFLRETIQKQRKEIFRLGQQRSLFELHDAALAAVANAIIITDSKAVIQWSNPAFSKLTGYTLEETIGRHISELVKSEKQDAQFYKILWKTILDGSVWRGEVINKRKNGSLFYEEMTITPVRNSNEDITHFIAVKQDVSERKLLDEQVQNLAFHDALTQLPNRRLLNSRLEQAMNISKRRSHYCALLFLDLDNFKPLNDTYGHDVGDLLLVEVANRISNCVRAVDTVVRFGGDEFVVILSELDTDKAKSITHARVVAEKIRVALAEPYKLLIQTPEHTETSVEHHCTTSIGVTLFSSHQACAGDIIKWADLAMYQSKAAGRNQIQFYDSNA